MRLAFSATVCLALMVSVTGVEAQNHRQAGHTAPYAGLETRTIKSLSEADIGELRRGSGWGLALPAELNGLPGPAHLLELKDEIGLSTDQVARIEAIHAQMKSEAIAAGESFIAAERSLESAIAGRQIDNEELRSLIDAAARSRAELRYVHLSRHLLTPPLLTEAQISRYNRLRGYRSDTCDQVPAGHDPEMWRRHNRCD